MLYPLLLAFAAQKSPIVLEIAGERPLAEAKVSKNAMKYLPFEVPVGVTRIDVRAELDYGSTTNRGIADLGLFDPRGYGPGGPGFRGWQGGAGSGFTLTGDQNTTSTWYKAGPIPSGTWHLAQYYLRAGEHPLKYKYTIKLSFDGTQPPSQFPRLPNSDNRTVSTESRYYSGNLHCHSTHSDGALSFVDLIKRNKQFGFDFVVSTEHNTPTAIYDFPKAEEVGPLLIIGTELTTPGGHAGILGQRPGYWWDFRTDPGDGGLPSIIQEVHRQNGVMIINHPFATCTTCTWTFPESEWTGVTGVEVWNSHWNPVDEAALAWWDRLLRSGKHLNAYGGTDYHRGDDALEPATWTYSKGLSTRSVMSGLRNGHTILSDSATNRHLDVTLDGRLPGDEVNSAPTAKLMVNLLDAQPAELTAFDANGKVDLDLRPDKDGHINRIIDLRGRKFLRFELRAKASHAMLALCNAFFLR